MGKTKPCKYCGSLYHWPFQCRLNPKKKKPLGPGKQAKAWQETRQRWFQEHPAKLYICHYCGRTMHPVQTTLDHMHARSRRPDLRYDFDNLVPCCWDCNGLKGSLSHDEYVHDCPFMVSPSPSPGDT